MLESVRATRAGVCDAALVAVNRRSMQQVTKGMYAVLVVSVQPRIDGRVWCYGFTNETVPMVKKNCKSIAPSTTDGVHRDPKRRHSYAKATARAEALVDLQNKVAELLGRTLPTADGPNDTRFGGDAVP